MRLSDCGVSGIVALHLTAAWSVAARHRLSVRRQRSSRISLNFLFFYFVLMRCFPRDYCTVLLCLIHEIDPHVKMTTELAFGGCFLKALPGGGICHWEVSRLHSCLGLVLVQVSLYSLSTLA